ncbi:MAG TPA: hypothetical protein VGB17_06305, partial [Pyrinomonadaceae bacterium]
HPVSTSHAEAQKFFDQGLLLLYAFNHAEAIRSFKRAAELDPKLAMAHWGVGLALGPNINQGNDPEREKLAYEAARKAQSLASQASEAERAYISALAKRYSIDPKADLKKLAVDYKNAMLEVSRRYPDDLDAATLYAESLMDLRPWKLWTPDGKPAEGTEEIIAVLESVLKRNPDHIGANHYYIHAVEASTNPGRALASADKLAAIVVNAGHLVHMPAHIYMRVGDYERVIRSNEKAAETDRAYIEATGVRGVYSAGYYSHNLHFLVVGYSMLGRYEDALRASDRLSANVAPYVKEMPSIEAFMTNRMMVLVRFHRWDDILKERAPARNLFATNAIWHWARGMAQAARGRLDAAEAERRTLLAAARNIPKGASFGLNSASDILKLAAHVLNARMAVSRHNRETAIVELGRAIAIEDALAYDEPPGWYLPSRETLGALLLQDKRAAQAADVFRDDLKRNPNNGRSLFGLMQSLKAQGKTAEAEAVQQEFEKAWKNADTQLRVEDL